jgi:hypothetical protein
VFWVGRETRMVTSEDAELLWKQHDTLLAPLERPAEDLATGEVAGLAMKKVALAAAAPLE